jgi:hypothetical protein
MMLVCGGIIYVPPSDTCSTMDYLCGQPAGEVDPILVGDLDANLMNHGSEMENQIAATVATMMLDQFRPH